MSPTKKQDSEDDKYNLDDIPVIPITGENTSRQIDGFQCAFARPSVRLRHVDHVQILVQGQLQFRSATRYRDANPNGVL